MQPKRNPKMPAQLTLDTVSPATRLLEKRRQMFEVQEALDAQKEEFERRETTFKRREDILKNKDRELQESLIKFNKFLQDNDSKRTRAEKKERDEVKLRHAKEAEITRLTIQLQEQQARRAAMMEELSKMVKYSHYLEDVLQHEAEFGEIADIISRYDTLTAAHEDLVARSQDGDAKQEQFRSQLQTFLREKSDEVLAQNNKIAELQKATEVAHAESLSAALTADRERKMKQLPPDADDDLIVKDLIEKLDFIQDYASDLTDIALRGFRAPDLAKKPLAQQPQGVGKGSTGNNGASTGNVLSATGGMASTVGHGVFGGGASIRLGSSPSAPGQSMRGAGSGTSMMASSVLQTPGQSLAASQAEL